MLVKFSYDKHVHAESISFCDVSSISHARSIAARSKSLALQTVSRISASHDNIYIEYSFYRLVLAAPMHVILFLLLKSTGIYRAS